MAKWCAIAPIMPQYPGSSRGLFRKPFDLGGVVICTMPVWAKSKTFTDGLSTYQRDLWVKKAKIAFMEENCSGLDLNLTWEKFMLANLALWLAKPSLISFEIIFHALGYGDTWSCHSKIVGGRLFPNQKHIHAYLTTKDLRLARNLYTVLADLERTGSLWIAVRTLLTALREARWELRYLLFWIVIEALFGPESHGEITYRLSQRVAFFLESDKNKIHKKYAEVREGYKWRSAAVHGMRLDRLRGEKELSSKIMYETEETVRNSLNQILLNPRLVKTFGSKNMREKYLDGLPFRMV